MKHLTLISVILLLLLLPASTRATTYEVGPGKTYTNSQLQFVLDSVAQSGDTIILTAGQSYGPLTLHDRSFTSYITIQSSALAQLPAADTRVSPPDSTQMPKIVSSGSGNEALKTVTGAAYYRFIGIEFTTSTPNDVVDTLINLGEGATETQANLAQIPHDLVFDRCYIHAYPTQTLKRGIGLNSRETSIINSYVSDFKSAADDSQAIAGWNGPGPFHIVNNYLEAAGENVMFGGADANNINNQPANIEIRRNHIAKQLSWKMNNQYCNQIPPPATTPWIIKNLLELKNARDVMIAGNVFEYSWRQAQGTAVIFTPRNQSPGSNPWANVSYVTFRDNIIRHVANALATSSTDNEFPSGYLHDIWIYNNLIYDVSQTNWSDVCNSSDGQFISFTGAGAYNLTIQHNTAYTIKTGYRFEGGTQLSGLVIKDNIAHAHYQGASAGTAGLNGAAPGVVAQHNVLVLEGYDGSVNYNQQFYTDPLETYLKATWADVGFADIANNNYRLTANSPFKSHATDGTDIGANINTVELETRYTDSASTVPPAAPTNFNFLSGNCPTDSTPYVVFGWSDNSNNETGFTVERMGQTDTSWTPILTTGPNAYKVGVPVGSSPYSSYYRVRAINNSGSSAPSDQSVGNNPCYSFNYGYTEDFGNSSRNASLWNLGVTTVDAASIDSTISVSQQNGQLSITPKPSATGLHYNGYTTAQASDFTGGTTSIQLIQPASDYRAPSVLSVGIDASNYCRIDVTHNGATDNRVHMSYRTNGGTETVTEVANLPSAPAYLRIRHLTTDDTIVWETSSDGTNWTTRRQAARGFSLSAVHVDLYSGTAQYIDPSTATIFDNFQLQVQSSSDKRFVFDSFAGEDGVELGTRAGEIGATWINGTNEPYAGSMYISNANRLRNYDRSVYYASGTPGSAEYDVQADFVLVGGTPGYAGLVGRFDPATGYFYRVYWDPSSQSLILQKSTATTGGTTPLGSPYTPGAPVIGSTHTIKLEIRNAAKKVYYDGVLVISSTDDELSGAGKAGIWFGATDSNTSGWNLDNFTASNP
jgi:hypothetical protein